MAGTVQVSANQYNTHRADTSVFLHYLVVSQNTYQYRIWAVSSAGRAVGF